MPRVRHATLLLCFALVGFGIAWVGLAPPSAPPTTVGPPPDVPTKSACDDDPSACAASACVEGNGRLLVPLFLTHMSYHGASLLATTLEGWVRKLLVPQKNIDLIVFFDAAQIRLTRLIEMLRLIPANGTAPWAAAPRGGCREAAPPRVDATRHPRLAALIRAYAQRHPIDLLEGADRDAFAASSTADGSSAVFRTPFDDSFTLRVRPTTVLLPTFVEERGVAATLNHSAWLRCGCPPVCPEKRATPNYVHGTRWYTFELLLEPLAQPYSYWAKLDVDIWMFRTLSFNIVEDLLQRPNIVVAHTGHIYNGRGCSRDLHAAIREYAANHSLRVVSAGTTWYHDDDRVYYSNFIVLNMRAYLREEVLLLSQRLADHPSFYRYRWTDQSLFHKVIGVFYGPQEGAFALDWSWLRWRKGVYRPRASFYHSKGFKRRSLLQQYTTF